MKNQTAFTLMEMLMYLALAAIFLGGILGCTYGLIRAAQDDSARMELLEESNLLAAKILWTFSGAKDFGFKDNPGIFTASLSSEVTVGSLVFQDLPATGGMPPGLAVSYRLEARSGSGRFLTEDTNFNLYLRR